MNDYFNESCLCFLPHMLKCDVKKMDFCTGAREKKKNFLEAIMLKSFSDKWRGMWFLAEV